MEAGDDAERERERESGREAMSGGAGWRALVAGGTGATGRHLVAELLRSGKFAAVTVIGRREIEFPSERQPSLDQLRRLHYTHVTDLAEMAALDPAGLAGAPFDAAFCALGTTRAAAGSAAAFRKIEIDGAGDFGRLAKRAGVRHLQLISSGRADSSSRFLYLKTKGEAEDLYAALGVRQLTVFRPPLLFRGDKARMTEKILKFVVPGQDVGDIARAMVRKAEAVLQSDAEGKEILEPKDIKALFQ